MAVMDKRHAKKHMLFWTSLDGELGRSLVRFLVSPDAENITFWLGGITPSDTEAYLETGEVPLGCSPLPTVNE